MKITKRQLRRIIREETAKATKQYDDDSALKGDQSKLPDGLQKGIIDKTVEDREGPEDEKKNEVRRLVRQMLREELTEAAPYSADADIIRALQDTWDTVRLDVGISNPTPEEMGDEAMAMVQIYYPEMTQRIAGKSNAEIDEILRLAFG